jgi:apolipoprotein D and lipocalin family protein
MAPAAFSEVPLETVNKVDLNRYLGRWYEIAKYPNRFERRCDHSATANYAIRPDGKISVVNACTTVEGRIKRSSGWAKVVDERTSAKLKVTFFWPFFGDYWIIDLGPNYEFAVVGEPRRKYLWVLGRAPDIDERLYSAISGRLPAKGYDSSKLVRMRHTPRLESLLR